MFDVQISARPLDIASAAGRFSAGDTQLGAVVQFTGVVRGEQVRELELEHYPGMTERILKHTLERAAKRWPVRRASVVHRVGVIALGEPIVWVAVGSSHRAAAFSACEFIMDFLKIEAPFWKKEHLSDGSSRWVESRQSDVERATKWNGASPAKLIGEQTAR